MQSFTSFSELATSTNNHRVNTPIVQTQNGLAGKQADRYSELAHTIIDAGWKMQHFLEAAKNKEKDPYDKYRFESLIESLGDILSDYEGTLWSSHAPLTG